MPTFILQGRVCLSQSIQLTISQSNSHGLISTLFLLNLEPTHSNKMKFITSLFLTSVATTTATMELATPDVSATSKMGGRLLSKARRLEGGKDDITWIAGYSLKFQKCVTSHDYYGGYFGGEG